MQMNFAGPAQIRHAIHGARREVLLAMPRTCSLDGQVDVAAAHTVTAGSGVSVKVFVPPADQGGTRPREGRLAELAREGMQIHAMPGHSPRMAIIDGSVVIWALNQEDYSDGAFIGHQLPFIPLLVRSLTAPQPAGEGDGPAGEEDLDPVSREVLRQLTLGTKDETAARDMGMALRTYRRMVARLMDSLDARSRFQAGYLAAQRNLLT
ncbi:hypothetical protein OG311_14390 [Streptomyces sp. NBC_01343]|uniref:hypothetical protein n=1 Tax=Streptomyces sp. NBC_01343 TaxID=2903832 RepID=UPI002E123A9B|nr:hypothetical protein OG311_14390 [Streptomyces sp. NBC_01343]